MLQPTLGTGDRMPVPVDQLTQLQTSVQEMQDAYEAIQQQMLLIPACTAIANDGTGCMNGKNLEAVLLLVEHLRLHLDNELDVFRAELNYVRQLLDGILESSSQLGDRDSEQG